MESIRAFACPYDLIAPQKYTKFFKQQIFPRFFYQSPSTGKVSRKQQGLRPFGAAPSQKASMVRMSTSAITDPTKEFLLKQCEYTQFTTQSQ